MVSILEEMEKYAHEFQIPIMEKEGIAFLSNFIKQENITSVLEIGSAIGYSAIYMCINNPRLNVVTIERDPTRYEQAIQNIKKANLEDRITLICKDAFDVTLNQNFDLLFIDAAKGQYIHFFEQFEIYLNQKAYVISDNLDFHGLVNEKEETLSKNVRGIVRKLKKYKSYLETRKDFTTKFYTIGDGIAVSKRV